VGGVSFRIAGTYLEACNCDAICPCRRIDGAAGGRSTHGICFGALSWRVDVGSVGEVDLAGSGAVMTFSYDDDVRGSPWTLVLHVDGPAELGEILLGRHGGDHVETLSWIRKPTASGEVRRAPIAFGKGEVRAGEAVHLRATTPFPTDSAVSCIVPGHDRPGTELVNDEVVVGDGVFDFELHGTCAFTRAFDYAG
jgi:hypothetical protein